VCFRSYFLYLKIYLLHLSFVIRYPGQISFFSSISSYCLFSESLSPLSFVSYSRPRHALFSFIHLCFIHTITFYFITALTLVTLYIYYMVKPASSSNFELLTGLSLVIGTSKWSSLVQIFYWFSISLFSCPESLNKFLSTNICLHYQNEIFYFEKFDILFFLMWTFRDFSFRNVTFSRF
jgi:hypothetical protein